MKISSNGIDYCLLNGGTKIMDALPPKVFEVSFSKNDGTWLTERSEITVGNFKIYGSTPKRVEKVFRTFGLRDRNLGVLLSGEKGMGKSVFMRHMSEQSLKRGLPVIVIKENTPGLADFIAKIEQECVVLIDEFDKYFTTRDIRLDAAGFTAGASPCKDGDIDGQKQFLPLLDGIDGGRKIFVVALNNPLRLSQFFINRPGRFYYHYRFTHLSESEVREYAMDKIRGDKGVVEKLVTIAQFNKISYDILSAIITELNNGYGLKETVQDLNIATDELYSQYDFRVNVGGIVLTGCSNIENGAHNSIVELKTSGSSETNLVLFLEDTCFEYDSSDGQLFIPKGSINNVRLCSPFGKYKMGGNSDECNNIINDIKREMSDVYIQPHKFKLCDTVRCLL